MTYPEAYEFERNGGFPNARQPVLIYRCAVPRDAAAIERALASNGWSNAWRNSIYEYHHFHSIAHEVLGVAAGEVTIEFGGPAGRLVTVRAGDVAIVPAGVAHCNAGQSADLLVVGAYPDGADFDIRRGHPSEYDDAVRAIEAVKVPNRDPVHGMDGPLIPTRLKTDTRPVACSD
jgi:uncharacterized protein YjlB